MKLTHFAQSCILLETKWKRILIDPGNIQYQESYPTKERSDIDLILVTHKHSDHVHADAFQEMLKNPKTKFYTSQEVANTYPQFTPQIVKAGDIITLDDIKIEVTQAVHGRIPLLKDGKEVTENIWYIVDDGENRIYQTSDTICFPNDYKCDIICVPVCNHGVVMWPFEATLFAKETWAKLTIPIHYDNPKFPMDINQVKKEFDQQWVNYKILNIGESVEI